MSDVLGGVLDDLSDRCCKAARKAPSAGDPVDESKEAAIDEWIRSLLFDYRGTRLTAELAEGLIPRILSARVLLSVAELQREIREGKNRDKPTDSVLLEWLLVGAWHDSLKAHWLDGFARLKGLPPS